MKIAVKENLSIALIDDHQMVREGFTDLIELHNTWNVTVSSSSYYDAINALANQAVDIAVIDISLPDKNGLELTIWLKKHSPSTKVIILSMHEHAHYIKQALNIGALAYVSKKAAAIELTDAITCVANNKFYLSPELNDKINQEKNDGSMEFIELLTPREIEIFKLTALGKNPKQIASSLDIDHKTVFTHRANIYQKLKIRSPFEALKYGIKTGAIPMEVITE